MDGVIWWGINTTDLRRGLLVMGKQATIRNTECATLVYRGRWSTAAEDSIVGDITGILSS